MSCETNLKFLEIVMISVSDLAPALAILGVIIIEPVHVISNNVVCATSKASDQPAHTRSLIRAFASLLSILYC